MNSEDIYQIMASKPHNAHYLKRYIKFIEWCKNNPSIGDYTEEHHVCPKSKDLFPEYKSFTQFPWNKVILSMDRHILAHVMLWKIYGGSMAYSLHYIINCADNRVPTKYERQYSEKLKLENREYRKGTAVYKDKSGNKFLLKTDDPRIVNENLVGVLSGFKMGESSKQKMRDAKDPYRTTQVYKFDGVRQSKSILVSDLQKYVDEGWQEEKPEEYIFDAKENQRSKTSEALTGTTTYYYPSGTYYGRIPHDSPIIKELGLIHIRSERQKAQATEQALINAADANVQKKKSEAVSKLNWYHNPETQERARLLQCPVGWKDGRGDTQVNHGKIVYNDGTKNYMLKPGETPDPSWVKGMAPQKQRVTNYTNGTEWIQLVKGQNVPTGFKKAKKPK